LLSKQGATAEGRNRFAGIRALHSTVMTKAVLNVPTFAVSCR
jgi:hypothetical protein